MIELVDDMGVTLISASATDDMVCMAAWVSHDMDNEERLGHDGRKQKLIEFLYKNKHMSPFEHGHFTFKVDVPLFVAREFMRHRTASYNEVSGRYTEMKPRFYVGDTARVQKGKPGDYFFEKGSDDQTAIYLTSKHKAAKKAWKEYQRRLDAGIAKEQAREDLPLSLMTQFYVTMNPRNLMQFLALRNEEHALKEIRDVAVLMEKIFAQYMPLTHKVFDEVRSESKFDLKALTEKVTSLERQKTQLATTLSEKERALELQRNKILELEARNAELINDYNKAFVASKESEKRSEENNAVPKEDAVNWDDVVDRVVPKAAEAVERLKPVYNIYVQNKDNVSVDEITKKILAELKKRGKK